MMTYKWKTIVQDIVGADYEVQESLDDDITEICQKGGWEVWQIDIIHWSDTYTNPKGVRVSDHIVQRVVTLRSIEASPITHQSVSMGRILELQGYSNEVQHAEDGSGDGAQGDVNYERALVSFYRKTREILGLK